MFDDFIKKYDGKGIDFDGAYGTQCVDLYRQYVKEVLKFPQSPPVKGAKDIWDTYLPDYFKKVENTPYGVPEKGDIVIFSSGTYGHVSIFIEGNASKFTSFDQNYPSGTLCHIQGHTYSGVMGWLKPLVKESNMPDWFNTLLVENNLSLDREGEFRAFFDKAKQFDDRIAELSEQVKSANETLADKALEVSSLMEKVDKLSSKVAELEENLSKARDERDQAAWEKQKLEIKVKTLEEDIETLQKGIGSRDEQIEALKMALKESQAHKIEGIRTLTLFKLAFRRLLWWKE